MFFRLLMESFRRQRRRKMLAGIAIFLGTTAVTAMLALATTIGDRIHKELAVYGANIIVYPKTDLLDVKIGGVDVKPATGGSYLKVTDLSKLKSIFWANNITGVSPELPLQIDGTTPSGALLTASGVGLWFDHPLTSDSTSLKTGAPQLHPWWKLQGAWPQQPPPGAPDSDAVLGTILAAKLNLKIGDRLPVTLPPANGLNPGTPRGYGLRVTGIVSTGDDTDKQILLPLASAQSLAGLPDAIRRVEISARTKPEDAFARVDPDSLPPKQREIWYCSPYANSIAYQIREAIPTAQADQVRRVEQSEGNVLNRISGLMWLVSAAALLAAGFAVSAAMATAVLERRGEIGLMRSLGASKSSIALLFYSETGLLAIFTGALGYVLGSALAAWLGARIFAGDGGAAEAILNPVLLPVVVALALIVAIAGSTPSIRAALRMDPSAILRADA
jgi:putative ABC transport system permease protein